MVDLTQLPGAKGFEFPTDTVLIAVGPASEAFLTAVENAVLASKATRTSTPISTKSSSKGQYWSVHVPVHVRSREELENAYLAINAVPGLRFRL